ncbi:MAG: signal peptide peptidase SppA [Pseudomonadota bacterium]|jgi:protease-4
MNTPPRGIVRTVLGGLWWALDGTRRIVLNLLFLAVIVAIVVAALSGGPKRLPERTVLVLDIKGPIVEQTPGGTRDAALRRLSGEEDTQTRLRDVVGALDWAARDAAIERVLLVLDDFAGAGLPTLREVATAIERVKAAGKQVVAWGSSYDQRQYYLAAHANEVYLHPMGGVMVEGYGRLRNYYRDALDRLGVSANVVRVGRYKNAAEPYFANAPSKETLESEAYLYDALWAQYTAGVERARKLEPGAVMRAIDALPGNLKAVGGDGARLALQLKLVDALKTRDELRALMLERGAADEQAKTFRQVRLADYLAHVKPSTQGDAVGIVVAEGEISDGFAPPGRIGGRSTAELIRKAREDAGVKALVLRVDSPGGSAFGSELVRRELELTRSAGKPVVVSMGDVAASGGYWISMAADQVIADAATITGSIGVFGMLPTAPALMDKLSVRTGGHSTTWLATAYDPRRALDPRFQELVQASVGHIYTDFLARVAAARKSTPEKIDEVAQGRVWTGEQALERGLVDRTGSLRDAVQHAAALAKLEAEAPTRWMEREPGRLQQLASLLETRVLQAAAHAFGREWGVEVARAWALLLPAEHAGAAAAWPGIAPAPSSAAALAAGGAGEELAWFAQALRAGAPAPVFAHCLCRAEP